MRKFLSVEWRPFFPFNTEVHFIFLLIYLQYQIKARKIQSKNSATKENKY